MMARPRSCLAKNAGTSMRDGPDHADFSDAEKRDGPDDRGFWAQLHHVEGFVDRDLRAALDHRARLRQLRRLVQGWRLDDAVARGALADGSFRHGAVRVDLVD